MTVVDLSALESALELPTPIQSGRVTAQYWAGTRPFVNVEGAEVTFPSPITVAIVDGEPAEVLELAGTGDVSCVKWSITFGAFRYTRYTSIPDSGTVGFGDLPVVDRATFSESPPSATQLQTIQTLLLDGLTLKRITQAEWDALPEPRDNTILYITYP